MQSQESLQQGVGCRKQAMRSSGMPSHGHVHRKCHLRRVDFAPPCATLYWTHLLHLSPALQKNAFKSRKQACPSEYRISTANDPESQLTSHPRASQSTDHSVCPDDSSALQLMNPNSNLYSLRQRSATLRPREKTRKLPTRPHAPMAHIRERR